MNRKEKLDTFMVVTNILDNDLATSYLAAANWDLQVAVSSFLATSQMDDESSSEVFGSALSSPVTASSMPSDYKKYLETVSSNMDEDERAGPSNYGLLSAQLGISVSPDFVKPPGESGDMLNITVLNEVNKHTLNFRMSRKNDIRVLKQMIFSNTGIKTCSQILSGWHGFNSYPVDTTKLSEVCNGSDLYLLLNSIENEASTSSSKPFQNPDPNKQVRYTLNVLNEDTKKYFVKGYGPNSTIYNVKFDTYSLTDIPQTQQAWTGWPEHQTDHTKLGKMNLNHPVHNLSVRKMTLQEMGARKAEEQAKAAAENDDLPEVEELPEDDELVECDEDEDVDFEAALQVDDVEDDVMDDDYMTRDTTAYNRMALIPENFDSELDAVMSFDYVFEKRYGVAFPSLCVDELKNAVALAFPNEILERKTLALYLHHDECVLANIFCSQIVCSPEFAECVQDNFIIWAWDVTSGRNKQHLQENVADALGGNSKLHLMQLMVIPRMPLIVFFQKQRSRIELTSWVDGHSSKEEVVSKIIAEKTQFEDMKQIEYAQEEERLKRGKIVKVQDEEYQRSLAIDKARTEAAQAEQEKAKQEQKQREEQQKKKMERLFELQHTLPIEPLEGSSNVVTVRFRLPGEQGTTERRFLFSNTLQIVFDYLETEGFEINDYRLVANFPRREFSPLSSNKTLRELNFHPQMVLMLEDRN